MSLSQKQKALIRQRKLSGRNNKLYDVWSIMHVLSGIVAGWLVAPLLALALLALYEPIEVLVLCPMLTRLGIDFGYEATINSLGDIFFDGIGVAIGCGLLRLLVHAPLHLS